MPISLKSMRGCASPAATAICTSTADHRSTIRRSNPRHHHRRLNSYLHDQYNNLSTNAAPCIAELPITPRSLHRKSSSGDGDSGRRKSYDEIREYLRSRRRSTEIGTSSRHLLSETASFREDLSEYEEKLEEKNNTLALVISEPVVEEVREVGPTDHKGEFGRRRTDSVRSTPVYQLDYPGGSRALVTGQARVKPRFKESTCAAVKSSSSVLPAQSGHQVVVLRVSLHCKGCVGKLRKHLSKLEGVASFSIDLETKRVTVMGSMSPLDVLTSISKVKNAQFWPSPSTSASSFSSSSSSVLSRSENYSM